MGIGCKVKNPDAFTFTRSKHGFHVWKTILVDRTYKGYFLFVYKQTYCFLYISHRTMTVIIPTMSADR